MRCIVFFFFKQKTAYEMRISDWSSDVCSSDLKKGSGMPISIPVVEMVEIGAGGGSMASIDTLRQIRVGPRSAGSEPGPACYGHGGTPATATAPVLWLVFLIPDFFPAATLKFSSAKFAEPI